MIIKEIKKETFTPITISITLKSEDDVTALKTIVLTDADTILALSRNSTIQMTYGTIEKRELKNLIIDFKDDIYAILQKDN